MQLYCMIYIVTDAMILWTSVLRVILQYQYNSAVKVCDHQVGDKLDGNIFKYL